MAQMARVEDSKNKPVRSSEQQSKVDIDAFDISLPRVRPLVGIFNASGLCALMISGSSSKGEMMFRGQVTMMLLILGLVVAGCETMQVPSPQPIPGPQGDPGPQGPPGETSLISWGSFGGLAGSVRVFSSGGPVGIVSFVRLSEGNYEIVYDIPSVDVGNVAAVATAFGAEIPTGENVLNIVSASQDPTKTSLTIEVVSVISLLDAVPGIRLDDDDALFSVLVFGNL